MGIKQLAGQYDRLLESVRSPGNSRDIHVGRATVQYGWTDKGEGWRLPGGVIVKDQALAYRAACIMDGEIARAMHRRR